MDGEMQNALVDSLSTLTERERAVILARFVHKVPFRTLANQMNTSPRTIQRVLTSALAKIEAALHEEVVTPSVSPDEKASGPPQRMTAPWATCKRCSRQAVPLTDDGMCVDICAPIVAATNLAFRVRVQDDESQSFSSA